MTLLHYEVDRGFLAAACVVDGRTAGVLWSKTPDVHAVNCERCIRTYDYRVAVSDLLAVKRAEVAATRVLLAQQDNDARLLQVTWEETDRRGGWPNWAAIVGARQVHDAAADLIAEGNLDVYA